MLQCLFDQTKANLAEIQLENHQDVQKATHFWLKAPGVNELSNRPQVSMVYRVYTGFATW